MCATATKQHATRAAAALRRSSTEGARSPRNHGPTVLTISRTAAMTVKTETMEVYSEWFLWD